MKYGRLIMNLSFFISVLSLLNVMLDLYRFRLFLFKIFHLPTPRGVYVSSEKKEYEKLKVFWHSQALTAILWVKDIVGWLALTALAWLEMTYLVSIKSAHFDEGGCPQGWPSGCLTSCDSPAHSLQLWYFRTLSTNYNTLYNY